MATIAELENMTERDLESWSYENLNLEADTKALLKTALEQKTECFVYSENSNGPFYTKYEARTMGKAKGDDLINDVCPIFDPVLQLLEGRWSGENTMLLDFKAKYDAFTQIRKKNDYEHRNVRAINVNNQMIAGLSARAKAIVEIDYNIMIFTILKSKVDACHVGENVTKKQLQSYQNILQTHFTWEENIISNCVDIPILPLIKQNRDEYFTYLREGIDAIKKMADSAVLCVSSLMFEL